MIQNVENATGFADVTLVSEDVQRISAHGVILSAPSTLQRMNYTTNPSNLLKNMKKNADRPPIKIKNNKDCIGYEFSSGAFSQVILPALEAMKAGFKDSRGDTNVEISSNNIRSDLINIADSSLIKIQVKKDSEKAEATVHVYLHRQSMLVQGHHCIAGIPAWKVISDDYLTPMLEANIMAKEIEIGESNAAITRKVKQVTNCTKCRAPLKSNKGLACQLCGDNFHISCTDQGPKKKALSQKEISWVCGRCRVRPATPRSTPSP